ncbi:glycosyl hydrolase [Sediminibacterium sp. C3]|uniref:glycosyl hydrolase n=1 Tax=Sediminibacterium sp. C3 TaxID=1267211 RepID=UPI0004187F95|nr:glycosyl hydrolase [Sediminibacterium sp. C3]
MHKLLLGLLLISGADYALAQNSKEVSTENVNQYFKPVKWRSIGPFRGGRSNTGTGVKGDIHTYYMGTTGGGVWKTTDRGITWNNISDGQFKTGSVGAIAVSESNTNIVYVGMGEHAVRGVMTHHGDGMYKSTDAGKTWKKIGLELTQHIARVIIDPNNPDIVYVAAQGALYSSSTERGVYKTTDGGISWKKVLYINEKTGAAELSMDAKNPNILYAAMWEHGRLPWKVISGGPGSGLYKSTDGGNSWDKLTGGLPKEMGKMAIAVSPANSEKVYALIESDFEKNAGGLYVSNNAGKSFTQVSAEHKIIQRAWYYIEVFPDPNNENTVYVLSAPALKSIDGGKTWENIQGMHGDYHNLWINPADSKNLVMADDGGVTISFNGGQSWSSQSNMPTAQIYRINVDNLFPYNIYGGQQDNTSVKIASRTFSGGITNTDWSASAGGESAFLAFDPNNPRYVLGGSYQGTIEVLDTKNNASTNIMAAPIQYLAMDAKDMKYRYNWNAPIIHSKHEPGTYYHAAHVLLRTRDMGKTWDEVSPDLTRNEKEKQVKPGVPFTNESVGAENYGTISYVMESPLEKGIMYTGSDDGLVHVTRDGGASWKNITPAGLSECLINSIEVSPFDKATVYIATTRYKFNDHTPGLYKSTDYGKTWTNISNGIPAGSFTRVVREDDKRKDLLYAGTENGVYISYNGGKSWSSFQLNLPNTPITDLRVHQDNLIAATSGRSFWILDDLTLIRQFKAPFNSLSFYQPAPAILATGSSELDGNNPDFDGTHPTRGVNPATGIVLYYELPELKENAEVKMSIKDAAGRIIRTFSSKADPTYKRYDGAPPRDPQLPTQKGLNRFVWNLRHATLPGIPNTYIESSFRGHKAIPGNYTITLEAEGKSVTTTATILPNPNYPTTAENYQEFDAFMSGMEANVKEMHNLVNELYNKKQQLDLIIKSLPKGDLKLKAEALSQKMKTWDEEMIQRKSTAYDDAENFLNKFTAYYMFLMNHAESDIPSINKPSKDLLQQYTTQWSSLKARGETINNEEIPALNQLLFKEGIGAIRRN